MLVQMTDIEPMALAQPNSLNGHWVERILILIEQQVIVTKLFANSGIYFKVPFGNT